MKTRPRSAAAAATAAAATSLLIVIVSASACTPRATTPPSARVSSFCDQVCTKKATCNAKEDKAKCSSRCTTNGDVRKLDSIRQDAADAIIACIDHGTCDKDLSDTSKACFGERIKTQPASETVKAMCSRLEKSFSGCDIRWDTPCSDELKLFPDEKLQAFEKCLNQGCKPSSSCFRGTEESILRGEI